MLKQRSILSILAIISIGYLTVCGLHPLSYDSAYYWVWSQHLQLSYFDHPPLIAYGIKFTTAIFGTHEFGVRAFGLLCYFGTVIYLFKLTQLVTNRRETAWTSVCIFAFMPVIQKLMETTNPSAPLLFFWMLATYATYRAVMLTQRRWFWIIGLAGGGMLLSHYLGVLWFLSMFGFLATSDYRREFKHFPLYGALILSAAISTPVWLWNAQHHWISFLYQYHHGMMDGQTIQLHYFCGFLVNLLLNFNPVFSIVLIVGLFKDKLHLRWASHVEFLIWPTAVPILFLGWQAFSRHELAHWVAPAYLTATILCAHIFEQHKWKRYFVGGLSIATLFWILKLLAAIIPGTIQYDHAKWHTRIKPIALFINQSDDMINLSNHLPIVSDSYIDAALLSFYMDNHPPIYKLGHDDNDEFDLWSHTFRKQLRTGKISSALYIGLLGKNQRLMHSLPSCQTLKSIKQHRPISFHAHGADRDADRTYVMQLCTREKG